MEDGGWRMEDGGWRMEDGGWRMEDGILVSNITGRYFRSGCLLALRYTFFRKPEVLISEGYPGSRMSFWQRVGRAGRTSPGLVVFIPEISNPMDYFFSRNPQALLGSHF